MIFEKLFHNLFFYKAKHYASENEYRLAVKNGNPDCALSVSPKINKVVIAENATQGNMVSVARLCQIFEIEVGQMNVSNDRLEYNRIAAPKTRQLLQ